jgi:hypothetical protein
VKHATTHPAALSKRHEEGHSGASGDHALRAVKDVKAKRPHAAADSSAKKKKHI